MCFKRLFLSFNCKIARKKNNLIFKTTTRFFKLKNVMNFIRHNVLTSPTENVNWILKMASFKKVLKTFSERNVSLGHKTSIIFKEIP